MKHGHAHGDEAAASPPPARRLPAARTATHVCSIYSFYQHELWETHTEENMGNSTTVRVFSPT